LQMGVRHFESSIAGLGGCPYAKGATGNVATEDVVYMLHGMGIDTGLDLDQLVDAADYISQVLGRAPNSRVSVAMLNKRRSA
jgi:hydroxymethylglutaryl-CoA lyase